MISFVESLSIIKQGIEDINYPQNPARLYMPISYLLGLKGKKIRPALTLLSYNLFKEDVKNSLNAALAWEIFHNFTLMHDDLMDNADMRRGEPSVHKKWNENTAILSGDAMLILAYKYIAKYSGNTLEKLLDLFSTTAAEIIEGQEYDLSFEERLDVKIEEYLHMIRYKTAVMIGASLKTGAIIAQATEKDQNLLYDFGINLGLAFQIQDDILDVYGDPDLFGKNIGGDILCNKKTYLLVTALNDSRGQEKEKLFSWIDKTDQNKEKIDAVKNIYDSLNVKEKARRKMDEFYEKSIACLHEVSVYSERKMNLLNLARELMDRKS